MRQFVLAVGLIFYVLANRNALAQEFWYVLPGYDRGYTYGFDLGNGVGYGYGAAIGIPLPLNALTGSKTAEVPQVQGPCCDDNAESQPTSSVDPVIAKLASVKAKPASGLKSKKSQAKVKQPKPVAETKMSKTPTRMTATSGQPT